jgi:hypothetical protein
MRSRIFRVLAAVIAVLFLWFLLTADHANRSTRELFLFSGIAVMFAVFAMFGTAGAERFMAVVFGTPEPDGRAKDQLRKS